MGEQWGVRNPTVVLGVWTTVFTVKFHILNILNGGGSCPLLLKANSEDLASKRKWKTQNHPQSLQEQTGERELAFSEHLRCPHPLVGTSILSLETLVLIHSNKGIYIGSLRCQSPFLFHQEEVYQRRPTLYSRRPPSLLHPSPQVL